MPSPLSRRSVFAAAAGGLVLSGTGTLSAQAQGKRQGLSVRGADLSFLLQLEEAGVRYRDRQGRTGTAEKILAAAGANYQRIRVWVDPPEGYTDRERALALGRRAKRAGLKIVLDPHYCDFWADPGKHPIPAGWPTELPALAEKVRTYTRDLIRAFAAQGTPVDIFQMGNEITAGILWPVGQLYPAEGPQRWSEFATLLKAGITGARQGSAGRPLPVMLHIDRGGKLEDTRWFFDNITELDVPFDIIGQSYYPMWHGSLADLEANLRDSVSRYRKPVLVAETSYPWTLEDGDGYENLITDDSALPDVGRFPATEAGQAGYYEALRKVLAGIPGGRGLGFLAWEPAWIPGVGWEPGAGAPNDNLTQFDFTGRALASIRAYRRP
ncbi:glycoside hydrolase family 53 protein [Kineosporia babensis]|uniref:Arabinogalactan endo-beta-1,4-galactanase n=1 Tax=Kineosporia babensis TaxID=499548 RepID=A0A9X1NAD5_9ACTN|nr:glycosyl hydrolase 53 family protein [Kineosporia babensis]MCD5311317.1 arabinogalactan endo-1,4-beta-galactosidase [Kineosporia babensis]